MALKKPSPLQNALVSVLALNSTGPVEALAVVQLDSTGGIISGGAGGGSTQVSIKEILTSSGASVMDSTESAIKVNVVAGAAGGSTYVSVRQSTAADLNAAVVQGSTVWQVQVSSLAGAVITRSSAANALVSVYQSTAADLNVTVAGYVAPSTLITVRQSMVGDFRAAVYQSTAGDLNVTVAGYVAPSTTVQVSSLGGAVNMRSSAANALVSVYQSTAADLNVTAVPGSTTWQVQSRELPGQTFTCGQVTINTTSAQICGANANRSRLIVVQHGGVAAFLGASTVTSTSGLLLSSMAGYPMIFRHDDAVYGITAGSTTIVSFTEETR
jgi:hypothetical protein